MNKQLLLLLVLGIIGSHSALAQRMHDEGFCSRVTAVERNGRGTINRVCFNETRSPDRLTHSGQVCTGGVFGGEGWWYYKGAEDAVGETAGKYFIAKTASPVSMPIHRGISLENTPGKQIVKGDFCTMVKVLDTRSYGNLLAGIAPPLIFEKMVCRQDAGTGLNGCSSQLTFGWQLLK